MVEVINRPDAATGTTAEIVKTMVDDCIKLAKEGKAPYVYKDMFWDGVRYGVSLSFHYIEGKFKKFVDYVSEGAQDEEFMARVRAWIELYIYCSDVRKSKSFLRKVKRNCVSVNEANLATESIFRITAAFV